MIERGFIITGSDAELLDRALLEVKTRRTRRDTTLRIWQEQRTSR